MIKVIWVNFSGSCSSSRLFQSLYRYSSQMSLLIGDLKEGGGELASCKANIENIINYDINIKDIMLNNSYVDYSIFQRKFYEIFKSLIKERFSDSFDSGRNLALVCEEELDVDRIVTEFLARLTANGYSFTPDELFKKATTHFPLQLHAEDRARFSNWIEDRTPVASSLSLM